MKNLSLKRKKRIYHRFHLATRKVINWCVKHQIDTLIIGYNKGWKQKVNIGKKNNQHFVYLSHYSLVKQLEYKCQDAGIHFAVTEEAYTSKCSFLDRETIQKHIKYKGRRIKRGLFRSKNGTVINADVNAAYNILTKVFPDAFEGIEGNGLYPERIKLFV